MKPPRHIQRLVDKARPASAAEAQAQELLRSLPPPPSLSAHETARIRAALDGAWATRQKRRSPARAWALATLLVSTPVAFAMVVEAHTHWLGRGLPLMRLTRRPAQAPHRQRGVPPEPILTAVPILEPPSEELDATPPPPQLHRGFTGRAVPLHAAPPPEPVNGPRSLTPPLPAPVAPSPVIGSGAPTVFAQETAALSSVLALLKQRDGAQAALAQLQRYREQFPSGQLRPEAEAAQVQALLQIGRTDAALEALGAMARRGWDQVPRAFEMQSLYGELWAARGRCDLAQAEFLPLLTAADERSEAYERALYGQATCASRLGNFDAAREALRAYLRKFPHGRFAEAARKALAP
jgi:TolA-binding protein